MAINLAKSGNKFFGFDADNSTKLREITTMSCIPSLLEEVDVVFTMLPSGLIVKDIITKFIDNCKINSILMDCSTIDVKTTKELSETLHKNNEIYMLDAPVSGGVQGAKSGELTFMVGGNRDVFEKVKFLFTYMVNRAVFCGKTGSGQSARICNNMILGVTMIATCESFALADKLGLDREVIIEVVSTLSGSS